MCQDRQEVIEKLQIDIDLLFETLNIQDNVEQRLICLSLLGYTPSEIAEITFSTSDAIRSRLSKNIYPELENLVQVDSLKGKWAKILNFLLDRRNGYRLDLPPLPETTFPSSMSMGGKFLLNRNEIDSLTRIRATESYSLGLYYQASELLYDIWQPEKQQLNSGDPEVLIYLQNCLIEKNKRQLEQDGVEIYTIAVVVPIYYNNGAVARQLLEGVAQLQLQVNLSGLEGLNDIAKLRNIIETQAFLGTIIATKMCLRVIVVNEDNNNEQVSKTAENLAAVAEELNIIAAIGHYSSEMTQKAVSTYARKGLVLISPASTSDTLSNLVDKASFFRIATPNRIATQRLTHYLVNRFQETQRLAILYNHNSIYSRSFRDSLCQHLQNSETIQILSCCQALDRDFLSDIKPYIEQIRNQEVNILVIVPDGGIERTLYNAELISAANISNCLIVGSAAFNYQNILDWLDANINSGLLNRNNLSNFLFVVPWHWRSQSNGFSSANSLAVDFCRLADRLWGEDQVTWRSATAYDSVLIVIRIFERNANQNCHSLFENMHQFFKEENRSIQGVTGTIQFDRNGDRINPPTEILTVQWSDRGHCEFIPMEI
jgi:ABC-type branched-subunit amino acid transport system substrate-binding protein